MLMNIARIVITDNLFTDCEKEKSILKNIPHELTIFNSSEDSGWIEAVSGADAILVNQAVLTREIIQQMGRCKIISRYGVGYDNVDIQAANEQGITVAIVPDYCRHEVAEHATSLLLACARQLSVRSSLVKSGHWRGQSVLLPPVHRLRGRTLGIIGYGKTGQALARFVQGFGFSRILIHSRNVNPGDKLEWGRGAAFEEVLTQSDYLTLHIPLNNETKHMLGESQFLMMKNNIVIVNTSRGGIIDQKVLTDFLKANPRASAGLDVLETEPPDWNQDKLISMNNVTLSDHSAYYSEESLLDLKSSTAENVLLVLQGQEAHDTVTC